MIGSHAGLGAGGADSTDALLAQAASASAVTITTAAALARSAPRRRSMPALVDECQLTPQLCQAVLRMVNRQGPNGSIAVGVAE